MKILYNVLVFFLLLAGVKGVAQDFVYTPKNPAFGGNPYNYSWLLSSAQAQNTHTDESYLYEQTKTDPMKDFAESLNQQILSQLARKIIANQFGEESLTSGTYILGNYQIEIGTQSDGIRINILDKESGSSTTVSVPYM